MTPAYHVRKWACYVIDANCQRASEMQYESRAVSLFALRSLSRPRYSRLAARGSRLEYRTRFLAAPPAGILEQKRDCSQSRHDEANSNSPYDNPNKYLARSVYFKTYLGADEILWRQIFVRLLSTMQGPRSFSTLLALSTRSVRFDEGNSYVIEGSLLMAQYCPLFTKTISFFSLYPLLKRKVSMLFPILPTEIESGRRHHLFTTLSLLLSPRT